jgi:hypothetical protein
MVLFIGWEEFRVLKVQGQMNLGRDWMGEADGGWLTRVEFRG